MAANCAKAIVSLLQVPLRLADESNDELMNALFRSGKWKDHKDAQRVTIRLCIKCFDGACVAMAIGCAGRAKA